MDVQSRTGASDVGLVAEVRRLKTLAGRTRHFPGHLNVGSLGGARLVVPLSRTGPIGDRALAQDVVGRCLDRLGDAGSTVWLTRCGALEPGDQDWRWWTATAACRLGRGLPVGVVWVVTRHGCLALPDLAQHGWPRLRPTWQAPYDDTRDLPAEPDPIEGWPVRF